MYHPFSLIFVFILALLTFSAQCAVHPEKPDLICHTSDLSECYPRIFEPTEEFQVVHDDQSVPPGLHIRMDMQTGLKEAKLYDPTADDESNAIQVVASDGGIESVDVSPEETPGVPYDTPQQAVLTGANEHVTGENPHRKPMAAGPHYASFEDTLREVASEGKNPKKVLPLLETLHESVDDPYYGMELARNRAAVQALASLVAMDGTHPSSGQAASVLGAAISNNGPANAALMAHHFTPDQSKPGQWAGSVTNAVRSALRLDSSESEIDKSLVEPDRRHYLFLLSKIWQDPAQRSLADLERLLPHFAASSPSTTPELDVMRGKLADLVSDNYAAGFRSYDADLVVPAKERYMTECDILLRWFRAFARACDAWEGRKWPSSEQNGGETIHRDARVRVHEARQTLAGVLTASWDRGGCEGKVMLERNDERRLSALQKAQERQVKSEL